MAVLNDAKKDVVLALKAAIGKEYTPNADELETPPDATLGDVAFPCFALSKGLRKNPAQIATELAAKIAPKGFVKKAQAAGPYVNFFFDTAVFGDAVLAEIAQAGDAYGTTDLGQQRRVMVEYAQPNTHKEIHIGHLRNFLVGQALVELLRRASYDVVPATYINDLGTHVAKCLWAMKKFHDGEEPAPAERDTFLGKVYTEATRAVEKNAAVKEEISAVYQDLENGKGAYIALWKKTRKWSLDSMKAVFKELGLPLDVWYYESDLVKPTRALIAGLKKKGIVIESQGALIVDLETEKLGVNLLVKTDGTLLYNAKDLALAQRKEEDYHPDKSLYVIDVRQSLAMQQLFATMKKMGFAKELGHLSYELVTLKDGAMSSRKGNIIRYEEFRDAMLDMARKETKERHADWSEKKIESVSRAVAFAAMRFGMLAHAPGKPIVFDMKEALSFDGFTGPYLLYTYARIRSIARKAGKQKPRIASNELAHPTEKRLLSALARYPGVVRQSATDLHLDRLAQYAFDLAKTFSEFYNEVPVLQAEDDRATSARLALCESVARVLKNSLQLLSIDLIDEM